MEIINERLLYPSYEMIGGENFMAPAANLEHGYIIGRLYFVFVNYFLIHKNGYVHMDNTDVHFSDGSPKTFTAHPIWSLKSFPILRATETLPLKKILTRRKALRNIGLSTRGRKALLFIFCATANIFSMTDIFCLARKIWKLLTTRKKPTSKPQCPFLLLRA